MKTTTLSVIPGLVISACCSSSCAHAFVIGKPKAPTRTRAEASISHAASFHRRSLSSHNKPTATTNLYAKETNADLDSNKSSIPITIERYEYDGWDLTYRYRPASPGHEDEEPLVLVHPVGIGCSSWIWTKMMEQWNGGAIYTPNLIGCGLEDGNEAWDPDARGLSVPLGWVKAVEALIQEKALAPSPKSSNSGPASCTVVVQGGSAPIGVLLASRNPSVISHLVLTSPPTWEDMTTATPEEELAKNYNFYRSFWGKLAFGLLESRWAVRLFSNLFLFLEECDDLWVDLSTSEEATTVEARSPVAIFNSGFLQHRSYEEELCQIIEQPALVISGSGDRRAEKRIEYGSEMKHCTLKALRGTNVLPWEAPNLVCEAIQSFRQEARL